MTMKVMARFLACFLAGFLASCGKRDRYTRVHGKQVDFSQRDDENRATSQSFIYPKNVISPYRQWNQNNGYCGEVSSIEAGMGAGLWMSQFNGRLICGAGLSQSGPNGFCGANSNQPNYNAQFLFEAPNRGDQPFASAPTCLANAHMAFQAFDYVNQATGMAGYRQYMTWIKTRLIAGDTVAIGVLNRGGDDPQYDHEVTVSKIGTNHSPSDRTYYDDDVLYFEDHGSGGGAFTRGYSFSSLAKSRDGANSGSANAYSILIPGGALVYSGTGGDGIHENQQAIIPTDYGFAVSGPMDLQQDTVPVAVTIVGSKTGGQANAARGSLGFNFENPEIGESSGAWCTNVAPSWMEIQLKATVTELEEGVAYNLYEYNFRNISGVGSSAKLDMPDTDFNANASRASAVTRFVAASTTYSQTVVRTSDQVIVFRCVRADAP